MASDMRGPEAFANAVAAIQEVDDTLRGLAPGIARARVRVAEHDRCLGRCQGSRDAQAALDELIADRDRWFERRLLLQVARDMAIWND